MQAELSETDYLVVGTGAAGMAFVDTLLSETDARIIMVDGGTSLAATGTTHIHSWGSISLPPFTASPLAN